MRRFLRFLKWAPRCKRRKSKPRKSTLGLSLFHRRLVCEPLEERRLLSVATGQQTIQLFNASPALFAENQGQWANSAVRYVFQGDGANVAMTDTGPVFQVFQQSATTTPAGSSGLANPLDSLASTPAATQSEQFSVNFEGANLVAPTGMDQAATTFNYLVGDQSQWHTNVPTYQEVAYDGLYAGIDLVTWGQRNSLKYEFHVVPGADYEQIRIHYNGIEGLSVDAQGVLHVQTALGELTDDAPVIYQQIGGQQVAVAGQFKLLDADTYTFTITGSCDPTRELVIDPDLAWSTYLSGSSNSDYGYGIAVDAAGNAYVAGEADSSNFPTTSGAFQTTYGGNYDAFVTKLNAAGSALVYSTYLGGNGDDEGYGIAVDSGGNAYVTGYTYSGNFPTTSGAFQTSSGGEDAFVTKLNAAGTPLVYSTYLGGNIATEGFGIAVDGGGNAYVTGYTYSSNFPTTSGAFQTKSGGEDAFVTKLNAAGSALVYSTYLGGTSDDEGFGIAVDAAGNAYVTGEAGSTNFPTTSDAFQTTYGGNYDAFVTKLNAAGSALVYSTYLGGNSHDQGYGIAVDSGGNAYVIGYTSSSNFPTTPGAFQTSYGGNYDAFVTKLNAAGTAPVYSTYLGGNNGDYGVGIAVDAAGNAYVTGRTGSSNFPTTSGAFQTSYRGGNRDAFVAKLNFALGIDVAEGTEPAWSSIGRTFAFIKATQGNGFTASTWPAYIQDAVSALTIAPYDYADPDEVSASDLHNLQSTTVTNPLQSSQVLADANAEADQFFKVASAYITSSTCALALDLEDDLGNGGFSSAWSGTTAGWTAMAAWVNDWTAKFQADETAASLPAVYPILYMNRNYAENLAATHDLNQSVYSLWIAIAASPSVGGTEYPDPQVPGPPAAGWTPTVWPWAIEQYNTTNTTNPGPPGDWDALNPSVGLDDLMIGQSQATVTGVSSTHATGTCLAGTAIPITVTFNKPVTVNGTPQLALNAGCGATASYTGGSGTATLTFTYTVAAGQNSSDLDYTSIAALALSGGTIEDAAGNAATLTLPSLCTDGLAAKNIVINTTLTVPPANWVPAGSAGLTLMLGSDGNLHLYITGTTTDTVTSCPLTSIGNIDITAPSDTTANLTIDSTAGDPIPTGRLNYSGAGGLVITGSGTVVLSGTNTYRGGTTVSAGTLAVTSANAIPSGGSLTVGDPSAFDSSSSGSSSGATTTSDAAATVSTFDTSLVAGEPACGSDAAPLADSRDSIATTTTPSFTNAVLSIAAFSALMAADVSPTASVAMPVSVSNSVDDLLVPLFTTVATPPPALPLPASLFRPQTNNLRKSVYADTLGKSAADQLVRSSIAKKITGDLVWLGQATDGSDNSDQQRKKDVAILAVEAVFAEYGR